MGIFNKYENTGVSLPKNKEATKDKESVPSSPPKYLYFPMQMHIGRPAEVNVEIGDEVKIGTIVGCGGEGITANVHSSVSGKVVDIKEMDSLRGMAETVVVENDFKDETDYMEPLGPDTDIDTFAERLRDAGITGKGGAGFPAAVKYEEERDKMHYLVINGAECEPYSTTDHRVMVEHADEIIKTMTLISKLYHIDEAHIAVEHPMVEAIHALKQEIKAQDSHVRVHALGDRYPRGHAGLQIREVLGIEIEEGERSGDVGVLQSNVSTVKAIHDAVFEGKPLYERIMTVTGPKIREPKNLRIRIGTPIEHAMEECGGLVDNDVTMIDGGPMMGRMFDNVKVPINKDTTTLLFLDKKMKEEETNCIRCARCIDHCPVGLQPVFISNAYKANRIDMVPSLKSESCISCGVCTYVCPANIPLLKNIQSLNKKWKELADD